MNTSDVRSELIDSIEHWKDLAEYERKMKDIDARVGDTKSHDARIQMYERTAKALTIQLEYGLAICSCYFKPFGRGTTFLERD